MADRVKVLFDPEVEQFLHDTLVTKATGQGPEYFDELIHILPSAPSFTTVRVNLLNITREEAKELLQQVLQQQYSCKVVRCPSAQAHPVLPDVLLVPCQGPRTAEIKHSEHEVMVDAKCGAAILRGADIFAPGVLAATPCIQEGDIVSVYADLERKCRKGSTKIFSGKKMFVGNGTSLYSREDMFCSKKNISGVAVKMTDPVFDSPSLSGIHPEYFYLQNLPSVVAGHVLNPTPGSSVLDMCAAPGGKSTHLATLMKNMGTLIALDKSGPKIERIKSNAEKLNLNCIHAFYHDGTKAFDPKRDVHTQVLVNGPPFAAETFDAILVDAPCSGLGQRPLTVLRMKLGELKSFPVYQKRFIEVAANLLKVGGTLVYSTCTVTMSENEELVAWALKTYPQLKLVKQEPYLGSAGFPGCGLSDEERRLVQRFRPTGKKGDPDKDLWDCDTIGFFIAKFVKTSSL